MGKTSVPSSSVPSEMVNTEESRAVHIAIARLVTRILNEDQFVPGVTIPLNCQSASPSLAVDPDVTENVKTSGDHDTSPAKNNEDLSVKESEVGVDDACNKTPTDKEDVNSDSILDESPAKCASGTVPDDYISDSILEESPDQETEPPVIDLDEVFSDSDLIANVNPSIAKRMMKRKGKQAVSQSPAKEK